MRAPCLHAARASSSNQTSLVSFRWSVVDGMGQVRSSSGVRGRDAAVDVQYVPGRFLGARAGEESDRLGDVLRKHLDTELRSAAVEAVELVLAHAVGARPL